MTGIHSGVRAQRLKRDGVNCAQPIDGTRLTPAIMKVPQKRPGRLLP